MDRGAGDPHARGVRDHVARGRHGDAGEVRRDREQPALVFTLLPFLASGFVPTATMPGGMQWFAENQPFTPIIETVRGLLLGTELGWDPVLAVGWCVVLTVVGYVWSMALYERKSVR